MAETEVTQALEQIAEGAPLRAACLAAGISKAALFRALAAPDIADRYARAREMQAIHDAELIDDAARELEQGARSGNITSEQVQAWRASIDARKWAAARKHPKVYGDRIEVSGKQDVTVTISLGAPAPNMLAPNIEREVSSAAPRVIEAQLVEAKGAPTARQRRKRKGGPKGA